MGITYNRKEQKRSRQYLRTHSTRAETVLWYSLKGKALLGYKFRRQYGVEHYVLDFYCPELRLAIELDGESHDSEEAGKRDARRQADIERHAIRFLRFKNEEVLGNIDAVADNIKKEILNVQGR